MNDHDDMITIIVIYMLYAVWGAGFHDHVYCYIIVSLNIRQYYYTGRYINMYGPIVANKYHDIYICVVSCLCVTVCVWPIVANKYIVIICVVSCSCVTVCV